MQSERLTAEKLRKYEGLEKVTDEEAEAIISNLERLCYVIFKISKRINQKEEHGQSEKIRKGDGLGKKEWNP